MRKRAPTQTALFFFTLAKIFKMKPIFRSYLIEVNLGSTVPGQGSNINIQDYPQLRNVFITGITSFTASQVAVSPSGRAVVPVLTGLTLTLLSQDNMEMIFSYPLADLNTFFVSGFYRDILPFRLQLIKSYLTVLSNTGLSANQSVLLNVFYVDDKSFKTLQPLYTRQ